MVLSALLASVLGILLLAPVAFAGGAGPPVDDQYTGAGPPDGSNDPTGRGAGADGTSLGPDPSVSPAGESASGGGSPASGGGSDPSTDSGSSEDGFSSDSAEDKAAKTLNGRSLGEVLSGGTERVAKPGASTDAGTRAAKAVSEDGGGAGLLWLLLALGAVTAVAAGGVAVRRRQARQGYLR
jgi:hypothetical protein